MKFLRRLSIVLFIVAPALAQDQGYIPASQADFNSGAGTKKFVSPATANGGPGYIVPPPLAQILQTNQQGWGLTNNTFGTTWAAGNTNGWVLTSSATVSSNGYVTNSNPAATALAMKTNAPVLNSAGIGRLTTTMTVGPNITAADYGGVGWETNSGATDNNFFFGFGLSFTTTIGVLRASGGVDQGIGAGTGNSSGVKAVANASTYNVCITTDSTNINCCFAYPGFTNIYMARLPWTSVSPISLSNPCVLIGGAGSNLTFGNFGYRVAGAQTAIPRTNVEGNSIFATWPVNSHTGPGQSSGDSMFIMLPPQMDSGTNPPNLILGLHGNTGNEFDGYNSTIGDAPTNGDNVPGYFTYICTNGNNIVAWYNGDTGGIKDTWNTTNATACVDAALNYIKPRWPYKHLFLWGESAGGATALGYIACRHEKVCGLLMNHAVTSISNTYNAGINVGNINTAYGGASAAQLATGAGAMPWSGDPYGLSATSFSGVPIRCESSFDDAIVPKTNQTDLLAYKMGARVVTRSSTVAFQEIITTGMPLCPEFDDVGANGGGSGAGSHGLQCYTPQMAQGFIAWEQRCIAYENRDPANMSFGIVTNGLSVGSTGCTNNTPHVYLVTLSAGVNPQLRDQTGTAFQSNSFSAAWVLRPGWSLTGSAIVGFATQILP